MTTQIQQAVQQDQAKLDQEWAEAREWVWSLGAEQAQSLDELLNDADRRLVLKAMRISRPTFDAVLYLAKLGYAQLINNCLDEQVAVGEAHDVDA
ncbi:MAG: hypothetical protein H0T51_07865 [Pirellulales bacterium]|nr:hypothetical protein [Pirellulales bacterium]